VTYQFVVTNNFNFPLYFTYYAEYYDNIDVNLSPDYADQPEDITLESN
jgi:hypothetical protein